MISLNFIWIFSTSFSFTSKNIIFYSSVKCYQMIINYILIPHSTGTLLVFPPEALIRVNSALLYFIYINNLVFVIDLILKYLNYFFGFIYEKFIYHRTINTKTSKNKKLNNIIIYKNKIIKLGSWFVPLFMNNLKGR